MSMVVVSKVTWVIDMFGNIVEFVNYRIMDFLEKEWLYDISVDGVINR